MQIDIDDRMPALRRISDLLYGYNYQVWVDVYGPFDASSGLEQSLRAALPSAKVSDLVPVATEVAKRNIMSCLFYAGDSASGPIDLDAKMDEINMLVNEIFALIGIDQAEKLIGFSFPEGGPAYSVFWEFAYDIHSNGVRWIFVGSSSD